MVASYRGYTNIVEFLISKGANIHAISAVSGALCRCAQQQINRSWLREGWEYSVNVRICLWARGMR